MSGTSPETLEKIEALDGTAYKRLASYAIRCFRRLNFRTTLHSHFVDGFSPTDIVQMAVLKILQGEDRQWDSQKCPDFMVFLKGVIKSDVSNACRKQRKRKTGLDADLSTAEAENESSSGGFGDAPSFIEQLTDHSPSPEELAETNEWHDRLARFKAAQSPEQQQIFEAAQAGYFTPLEIAEVTGMTVEAINNHKRTLKRKWKKINP